MKSYNPFIGQSIETNVGGLSADRGFIAKLVWTAAQATATSNVSVHEAIALTDAAQNITTGITNPTCPRNIVIKGSAASEAGNVVITGTNINNEVITETIALNAATAVLGAKAFKTVTKITLPVLTTAGDTVSIGTGDILGLPYLLSENTVLAAVLDGTKESTAPAVTVSATAYESNTIDLSSALNAKIVKAYLIV